MARQQLGTAPSRTRDVAEYGTGPGGGAAKQIFALPAVGEWIGPVASAIEATRPANGSLLLGQFWLAPGTYTDAVVAIANVGSTGSLCRFIIYGDSTTSPGRPSGLLLDSGAVNGEASPVRASGFSLSIPAGGLLTWAGVVTQGAPSSGPNYQATSRSALPPVTSSDPAGLMFTNVAYGWSVSGVTGAAPTAPTFTAGQFATPRPFLKRTA